MGIFHTDTIAIKDIDIESLISEADLDKDGEVFNLILKMFNNKIDYNEFLIMLIGKYAEKVKGTKTS